MPTGPRAELAIHVAAPLHEFAVRANLAHPRRGLLGPDGLEDEFVSAGLRVTGLHDPAR